MTTVFIAIGTFGFGFVAGCAWVGSVLPRRGEIAHLRRLRRNRADLRVALRRPS